MMRSGVRLTWATVLFDVLAAGVYLVVFVALGERLSTIQALGAVLALLGVILMSL